MPLAPFGPRDLGLGQAVAIGRHGAQQAARRDFVKIDAVQIVAGLLGRDRKAGLLDEALERRQPGGEAVGEVRPRRDPGKSSGGRACSAKRERPAKIDMRLAVGRPVRARAGRHRAACARCRRACGPARSRRRPWRHRRARFRRSRCRDRWPSASAWPPPACISTLDRIGMVLRRSTTLCTWFSALRNADRSIVTRITGNPSVLVPGALAPGRRHWRGKQRRIQGSRMENISPARRAGSAGPLRGPACRRS